MRRRSGDGSRVRIDQGYGERNAAAVQVALAARQGVLVLGPVGSGRSALLEELATLEAPVRRVWWCRGRAFGDPSGAPPLVAPEMDLGRLHRELTGEPTTVLIDDSHLLTDGLLCRMTWIAERREELDARVIATRRPVRPGGELARFEAALLGPTGALHVSPLPRGALADWLAATPDTGRSVDEIILRTGGWPELVAAELAEPPALADLIAARLGTLPGRDQTIVRALAFGLPAGTAALAGATSAEPDDVDRALDRAGTAGLLHGGPEPLPAVAEALRDLTPAADRARIATAVGAAGPNDLVVAVGRHLAVGGDRSPAASDVIERAADILATERPDEAQELYAAVMAAGRPAAALAGKRAMAALASGRPGDAIALASNAESAGGGAELNQVAGAAWAHLARPDLAATHLLEAGAARILAVAPLLAAGRPDDARAVLAAHDGHSSPAARAFADGALAWMAGDVDAALAALDRSAQLVELRGDQDPWPESPHALLTAAAVATRQVDRADRTVGSAIEHGVGGRALATRHRLLQAWVALRAGRFDEAAELLAGAAPTSTRDVMLAAGLEAALALRRADPGDLPKIHQDAIERWWRGDPDAFVPDVTGEVAQLAARIGADAEAVLGPLERVAEALGQPATLCIPLAWARLMTATLTDDARAARAAAQTLIAAVADDPRDEAGRLLADAAGAFASVLAGDVDAGRVRSIAERLVDGGLVHEATRLLGTAGLRSDDATGAKTLLRDLRRLQAAQVRTGRGRRRVMAALSAREKEVARAVLEGHTHREIGAQLYISPKTVEHHVAKLRQKLGATTRAHLLAAIREALDAPA